MKKILYKIRMPKDAGWLLPGLQVKRWFGLIILGTIIALLGLCVLFNMRPVYFAVGILKYIAVTVNQEFLGVILLLAGAYIFLKGWKIQIIRSLI